MKKIIMLNPNLHADVESTNYFIDQLSTWF